MYGGVRFGGTLTIDSAFELGFDHIALCAGAGQAHRDSDEERPDQGSPPGIRFSDGAAIDGRSQDQLRSQSAGAHAGGGDRRRPDGHRYRDRIPGLLSRAGGEVSLALRNVGGGAGVGAVRADWNAEEQETADEFIAHGKAIRAERAAAAREGRPPNLIGLLNSWGGVTMAYRRRLIDSPSYTLNHEEISKAMEEGVQFAECLNPHSVEVDEYGASRALRLTRLVYDPEMQKMASTGELLELPARTILVAAGTQPNTVLGREDPQNIVLDGKYFQAVDEDGNPVKPERLAKPSVARVLMSVRPDGRGISFFGDLHPSFGGNVVKAMGGAKQGYPVVSRFLSRRAPSMPQPGALAEQLNYELRPVVQEVVRLTPDIVDVIVRAPRAARMFHPGQFYRLQNYETYAGQLNGTTLAMEGIALTGASVDREKGLLSTIVLEVGGSSDLCGC